MDLPLLDRFLTVSGPWGIVGILIWLLIAEVRHNTELRAEMRSTADAVRAAAAAQVAALDRVCNLVAENGKRAENIQSAVNLILGRPKTRVS